MAPSEEQEKELLLGERRKIPHGHPIGLDHSYVPEEGWAAPTLEGPMDK